MPTPEEIAKEKKEIKNAAQRERYRNAPPDLEAKKAKKEQRQRAEQDLRINDPKEAEARREQHNASRRVKSQDSQQKSKGSLYNAEYMNPSGNPELGALRRKQKAARRKERYRRNLEKEQAAVSESNGNPVLPMSADHSADMEWFNDKQFSNLTLSPPHLSASPGVDESTELAASFSTNEGNSYLPATDSDFAPSRHGNQYPAPNSYGPARPESRDNYASPTNDLYSASPKNKDHPRRTSRDSPAGSSRHSSAGLKSKHGNTPPATDSRPAPPVQSYNSALNTTKYASGKPMWNYDNAKDGELSVPNAGFRDSNGKLWSYSDPRLRDQSHQ
ncbi:hypothetical protein EAE96_004358 [Botrytis aclada]|nr:hypothetical protein EAE96_004358 [Botrytis aclada]